jgi:hypothetical protein
MYYEIIEQRCVPVEKVTVAVFFLILYRYQLQFGGATGPPSTFPLMKAWTSDGALSSGHASGSLCSRLEIGVVGSEVGRFVANGRRTGKCGHQRYFVVRLSGREN